MPKRSDPLSDTAIRKAKPEAKDYKLSDGNGLHLLVRATGGKSWRFNYRFDGKQKTLSLGIYPDVPLAEARNRLHTARQALATGIDPAVQKQAEKQSRLDRAANSFEAIAREWHTIKSPSWTDGTSVRNLRILELYIFPWLGNRAIAELEPADFIAALRRIEAKGTTETAHRCAQYCNQVCRYAIQTGRLKINPCGELRGALVTPKEKHYPSIIIPAEIGALMRAIDGYAGEMVTRCALQLLPLVFVRPGELRHAEWSEIDLEAALWSIPASKMKMSNDHIVPLSQQALAILRDSALDRAPQPLCVSIGSQCQPCHVEQYD